MEYKYLFRRRKYSGFVDEPLISYVYRLIGFLSLAVLSGGSAAALLISSVFPIPFTLSMLGAVFGMILFCTGLTVSEVWAHTALREWGPTAATPYPRRHLALSVFGFLVSVLLIVFFIISL